MKKKKIFVVGLGILGETVARTLASHGVEVIAMDCGPQNVERIKDVVAFAVEGDATDPILLDQLGIRQVDTAIVCIGENFPAALMTTIQLIDLGVKNVAVRATSQMYYDIFKRIGAHDVFFVENEMGKAIAHRLISPDILNEMDLGGGLHLVEVNIYDWMEGKGISDISLHNGVQIVAVRDALNPDKLLTPSPDLRISKGMKLLISGRRQNLIKVFQDG